MISLATANSSAVTPPEINMYRFTTGQPYLPPQPQQTHWMQETERPGVHSSSIYIDPPVAVRKTVNVQEAGGQDPGMSPLNILSHQQYRPGGAGYLDNSQGLASLPPSMSRSPMQPLTVTLSSHAAHQGTPERGQNAVPYQGFPYNPVGFNTGFPTASLPSSSGASAGNERLMMNVTGGPRYGMQETGAQRGFPTVGFVTMGVGQLNLSPVVMGPPPASSPSPSSMGPGSLPMMPRSSPQLQHQRSTGSSTSRSDSMDSEHGSVNCHFPPDFASLPPTNNHPYYPSTSQRVGGVQMVGLGMVSPSSSQSSLSSESSAAATAIACEFPRPRSGSLQEEVAYAQGNFVFLFSLLCAVLKKKLWHEWVKLVYICFTFCCSSHKDF
jgi:hypothetical protein